MQRFLQMLLVILTVTIATLSPSASGAVHIGAPLILEFGKGKGLLVFADGKQIAHTQSLDRIKVN